MNCLDKRVGGWSQTPAGLPLGTCGSSQGPEVSGKHGSQGKKGREPQGQDRSWEEATGGEVLPHVPWYLWDPNPKVAWQSLSQ